MNETYREKSLPIGWLVLLMMGAAIALWAIFFGPTPTEVSADEGPKPEVVSDQESE